MKRLYIKLKLLIERVKNMYDVDPDEAYDLLDLKSDYRRWVTGDLQQDFFLTTEETSLLVKYTVPSKFQVADFIPVGTEIYNHPEYGWIILSPLLS